MAKRHGAGGQWAQPWSSLDHARSGLMHVRMLLRRDLAPGEYPLLTADEADLLRSIDEALFALERIMD